jgi:hypothetical protein
VQPLVARIEQAGVVAPAPPRSTATGSLRLEGEYWSVVYESDAFRVKDTRACATWRASLPHPARKSMRLPCCEHKILTIMALTCTFTSRLRESNPGPTHYECVALAN